MKLTSEQIATFGIVSADNYSKAANRDVDECRQTVGYHEDPTWVCPKFTHGDQYLREKYPNKKVAGLTCFLCLVKESNDWCKRGLPLPLVQDYPCTNRDNLLEESCSENISLLGLP